jgi:hypothetical protein
MSNRGSVMVTFEHQMLSEVMHKPSLLAGAATRENGGRYIKSGFKRREFALCYNTEFFVVAKIRSRQ